MGTPRLDLWAEAAAWRDTVKNNARIVKRFTDYVNADPALKEHRDFVEEYAYGFGERAFLWLWKLLVDEMPEQFRFLEIGVYKGQVPSIIRLLADRTEREAYILGVTPLSSEGGEHDTYPDEDYLQHIKDLHAHFGQQPPTICKGDSTDTEMMDVISSLPKFDIVYIDGGHDYNVVVSDIMCYGARVKPHGYLVVDDASNYLAPVWDHFQGIEAVSAAVRATIETDAAWDHLLAVMHLRIWRQVGPPNVQSFELKPLQQYAWKGQPPVAVKVK